MLATKQQELLFQFLREKRLLRKNPDKQTCVSIEKSSENKHRLLFKINPESLKTKRLQAVYVRSLLYTCI